MNRSPRCSQCRKRRKRGHWGPHDQWICHECCNLKERKETKYILSGSGVVKDENYIDISTKTSRGGR